MEQKKEVTTFLWERLKERKYYFLIAVCLIILYQLGLGVFVSKKVLITLIGFLVVGIFLLPFDIYEKKRKTEITKFNWISNLGIHNYTCIMILLFGLLFAYFAPVYGSPDENVHGARAIHLVEGHLFIDTNRTARINGIQSIYTQGVDNGENLYISQLFDQPFHVEKEDTIMVNGAKSFPFLSYIPQAIGIAIGDVLGVNAGIVFLLGRICNLICYALFIRYAVKIAPAYKGFLSAMGMFPMSVYLGASYNPEATVTGLGLVTIGYFIRLCYKEEGTIGFRQVGNYLLLCSLMAVVKLPYALLIGLLLFLPQKAFSKEIRKNEGDRVQQDKKQYFDGNVVIVKIISVGICGMVALAWLLYSMHIPDFVHEEYLVTNGVDTIGQLKFALSNVVYSIKVLFFSSLTYLDTLMRECFTFGWLTYTLPILPVCYIFVMGGFLVNSQKESKITATMRMGVGIVAVGIYLTIFAIQFLNWTPVGANQVLGVQGRYFVLVLALLPLIFGNSTSKKEKQILFTALIFLVLSLIGFFVYF